MRFFLEIQYDGANYHGWQKQPNAITVQEVLAERLSRLLRTPTEVIASGRTDTGVHCSQQYAHFDTDNLTILPHLQYKLNSILPHDIGIRNIHRMKADAHARFSATRRSYVYRIHTHKDPFLRAYSYRFYKPLDLEKMNEAAAFLKGFKDFEAFSKTKTEVKTFLCDIFHAEWVALEDGKKEFHITANRFLRGMVRLITGALLDIGTGKLDLAGLEELIRTKRKDKFRNVAPAHGLYLCKVAYPPELFYHQLLPA
ncbi:MAG: tRNA pseudouridine(38-40) synthase TruA [Flammeovirgaceae bacterium]